MIENNENKIDENIKKDYYNLNEQELIKAKENCFVLIGQTGSGKTTLLNVLYEKKEIGKVGHSLKSETKESNYYPLFWEENNEKKYFCIIDTPGLYDYEGEEKDEKNIEQLKNLIFVENLKIKGFLYLSNFQKERFDNSEIMSLIKYNSYFPNEDFWKRIVFIFSHYYGDKYGDTEEEMKMRKSKILSEIFKYTMNKVKNVSKPITFKELNCKYINIYSPVKNEIQKNNNKLYRDDIIHDLIKFIELKPLFSEIKKIKYKNLQSNLDKEHLFDVEAILYYDLSGKNFDIEYKRINLPKKAYLTDKEEIEICSKKCEFDKNRELKYVEKKINNYFSSIVLNKLRQIFSYIFKFSYEDLNDIIEKEKKSTINSINEDIIKNKYHKYKN